MKRRTLFTVATYLVAIHLLLFIVLLKSNFIEKVQVRLGLNEMPLTGHSYYIDALGRYYANRSKTMRKGDGIVFIGDSITIGLSVETIFGGVNFGISGDTVMRAKKRVSDYENLESKTVFIALGINDIPRRTEEIVADYHLLLDSLPPSAFVIISSVLPLDELAFRKFSGVRKTNEQIFELNTALFDLASKRENVVFIDSSTYLKTSIGDLNSSFHKGDGIHPNLEGYSMWIKGIKEQFKQFVEPGRGGDALRRASL